MQRRGIQIAVRVIALLIATLMLALSAVWLNPSVSHAEGTPNASLVELHFTILHTNDEHSAVIPHSPAADYHPEETNPTVGGFARLASAVEDIRDSKGISREPVILLSAGDFLGGSAFGWLAPRGHAVELSLMQRIGYDAVAIGNHEYDYGPDILAGYLQAAGYPQAHQKTVVLASNTQPPPDHPLASLGLYRKVHILELENGLTVGLFGLIGSAATSVTSDTGDLTFLDQHQVARESVEELKTRGAQVIVAITHAGIDEDRELARGVPGIDVIVGGHCHSALHEPIVEGETIIVQAGSRTEYLGQLELAYNPSAGRIRVRNLEESRPFLIPIDSSFDPHPEIQSLVDGYTQHLNRLVDELTHGRFADIMQNLAHSDFVLSDQPRLQESPMGNFVTDAMRLVVAEKTGRRVDLAIQANGNIRGSTSPGTLAHSRGVISFYDLAEVVGLGYGDDGDAGYALASCYLTGEEIRRVLEVAVLLAELRGDTYFLQFSGLRYRYNPSDAVLLTLPFVDQPIPSTRAVKQAELYVGEGFQQTGSNGYVPLNRGDEKLYHVVTDTYILSFLPLAGEVLPQLEIVPKNSLGEPVPFEHFDDLVIDDNGRELKVWQAVVEYAASQPLGEDGVPRIADYYRTRADRIVPLRSIPLVYGPVAILAALGVGTMAVVRRRARRGRTNHPL